MTETKNICPEFFSRECFLLVHRNIFFSNSCKTHLFNVRDMDAGDPVAVMQHGELRAEHNDSICFVPGRIHQPLWSSISVLDIFHINGSRLTANDVAVTKPERLHSVGQTFIKLCIIWNA